MTSKSLIVLLKGRFITMHRLRSRPLFPAIAKHLKLELRLLANMQTTNAKIKKRKINIGRLYLTQVIRCIIINPNCNINANAFVISQIKLPHLMIVFCLPAGRGVEVLAEGRFGHQRHCLAWE